MSKDRAFGEYIKQEGNLCPCYEQHADGPPQYDKGDPYFCFSKFSNPFLKTWIPRYVAISIMAPKMELIEEAERGIGRPLSAGEWQHIPNALFNYRPQKRTERATSYLTSRVELFLADKMIDEIDHRLVDALTVKEYAEREPELMALYGSRPWAALGKKPERWMEVHSCANTLEMLRRCDALYEIMPPRYQEVAVTEEDEGKAKGRERAQAALSSIDSVETVAI